MTSAVVIALNDRSIAKGVARALLAHSVSVAVVESPADLPAALLHHKASAAILDLEAVSLDEVREVARNFDELAIVCTHRSPDERLWMAALNAGAVEFCHPADSRSILRALRRNMKVSGSAAA
jgi:DNA-binding NtrC family response regulator